MQNTVAEGWTQRGKGICHRVSTCLRAGSSSSQGDPQKAQKDLASPGMGQRQEHNCWQLHRDCQKAWNAAELHC